MAQFHLKASSEVLLRIRRRAGAGDTGMKGLSLCPAGALEGDTGTQSGNCSSLGPGGGITGNF